MTHEKHIFALHYQQLDQLLNFSQEEAGEQAVRLIDESLMHRMQTILRLRPDEPVILFNRAISLTATILRYEKKSVLLRIDQQADTVIFTPPLMVGLPLLKRDDLEAAIYGLTEVGVNEIQLLITQKSRQSIDAKEYERLNRLVIAAAEQAKNYHYPLIMPSQPLDGWIAKQTNLILFYPDGSSLAQLIPTFSSEQAISIIVGPEGGLTEHEHQLVINAQKACYALTPTVLRAQQAVVLGAAIIRSLLKI